jgi:damage-control phosphatase, subfamily I
MLALTNMTDMISDYRCFFCFARAYESLLQQSAMPLEAKNRFVTDMGHRYASQNHHFSAPAFARELHCMLRESTGVADPYVDAKKNSNDLVMGMYPALKQQVIDANNPYNTALRLAIAGNIIDFAVSRHFDLDGTIEKVLNSNFAIDHSEELKSAISQARSVLYLGDNCGEIVFDKLFIEHLMHPSLTYAVRGAPAINDATMDDALYVGMHHVADVVSNGYDAPSTLLEHCSEEFIEVFNQADVIISKGQGNLEGLWGKTNKRVFFLLMVKCDVIADALQVKTGDFVVVENTMQR